MNSSKPSTTWTDAIVFRSAQWAENPHAPLPPLRERPVGINGRFDVAPDLFIVRIGSTLTGRISASVNAGGIGDAVPETYTLFRERTSGGDDWDADGRLQLLVALSRLVHPTAIGFEQSATLFGRISDPPESVHIRPGPVVGPGATAYVTSDTERNWLTVSDAEALRDLQAAYSAAGVPPRVARALWFHESASRQMDIAVRWAWFVTAIEALISVSPEKVVKQFVVRTLGLSTEVGVGVSKRQLNRAYANRSKVDHGTATSLPRTDLEVLIAIEAVLRATLRKAILERSFREVFEDDSRIEQRWPVATE